MPARKTNTENSSSERFLIEEYQMLRERFHNMRTEGINRINLLFTVTSAVLGGVLLFDSKNSSFSPGFFQLILLIMLLILAAVGYDIYLFLIARDRVSDRVERGMARIRRYFVEKDKDLEKYLVYTTYDNPTTYLSRSNAGLRRTVQIIESFIVTLISCLIANMFVLPYRYLILTGISIFILTFTALLLNARRLLKQELKLSAKYMKFPPEAQNK
jgi:hypothetical protein